MNDRDREKIDVSFKEMASEIDMIALWPKLLANGIFNSDDCNIPTWSKSLNNVDTKKEIILTIKTRGPNAFKKFLLSLRQAGYDVLANNLNESEINSNDQFKDIIPKLDDMRLINNSEKNFQEDEEFEEEEEEDCEDDDEAASFNRFLHDLVPLQIAVKKSRSFRDGPVRSRNDVEKYIMRSKPRGFVLIVCNIEYVALNRRCGAQHDENNLKKLFEDMGFEVTLYSNVTGARIRKVVKEFAARADFRKVDSCFVIFSCHGREAGKNWDAEISGIDYQEGSQTYEKIYCSEVTEFFSSENCKQLIGKPKIFIFQMCRGENTQWAVSRHETDSAVIAQTSCEQKESKLQSQFHRNYQDTLIVHATTPGHCSFRDTINGSWCIQVLCKVFMKEAHCKNLIDLFNTVDQRLEQLRTMTNECQTLTVTNMGFNKHCFLNPGYFGETQ